MRYLLSKDGQFLGIGAKDGYPGGVVAFRDFEMAYLLAKRWGGNVLATTQTQLLELIQEQGIPLWEADEMGYVRLVHCPELTALGKIEATRVREESEERIRRALEDLVRERRNVHGVN